MPGAQLLLWQTRTFTFLSSVSPGAISGVGVIGLPLLSFHGPEHFLSVVADLHQLMQTALLVFLLLLKRMQNSLFSPFSTERSLLADQELAWRIFQLCFPASLSVH